MIYALVFLAGAAFALGLVALLIWLAINWVEPKGTFAQRMADEVVS